MRCDLRSSTLDIAPTNLGQPPSDSQIAKGVLLNNADFNRERTNKRNAPNDADFNEVRMPEFGQEKQSSFEKSDGGTKSKVGRLISQFQEFAKVSSEQSRQSRIVCFAILFAADRLELAVLSKFQLFTLLPFSSASD